MTSSADIRDRLKPLAQLDGKRDTHLLINEIYASIQGESTHVGRPCTFIRTAVCNQRCSYCDTAYAFTQGSPMHIDDVVKAALEKGPKLVEVTGGEPLLQPLFPELCRRLLDAGCEVLVETGGSHDISVVPEGVRVILDIKTPGSNEEHANDYGNLQRLRPGDEVKFVLTSRADYDWALELTRKELLAARAPVLFSPAWGLLEAQELAAWMLEDTAPARLNLQQHKHIWPPNKRGV
jgi:7-carboxy-7-deazaguanine synthase